MVGVSEPQLSQGHERSLQCSAVIPASDRKDGLDDVPLPLAWPGTQGWASSVVVGRMI